MNFYSTIIALFLFSSIVGQSTFHIKVPPTSNMHANVVLNTERGFLVVGNTGFDDDVRLIEFDFNGLVLLDTTYTHTPKNEFFIQAINAFDGGYIIACKSYSYPLDDLDKTVDMLVWKINTNGVIEWQRILPSLMFNDIISTSDSTYLILGDIAETDTIYSIDAILYNLDIDGNIIWEKQYGLKTDGKKGISENSRFITEIDNEYYIACSRTFDDLTKIVPLNGVIYKINKDGEIVWEFFHKGGNSRKSIHISSIFKIKNELYYKVTLSRSTYRINEETLSKTNVNDSLLLRNKMSLNNTNYSISCNEIHTVIKEDTSFYFIKLDDVNSETFRNKIDFQTSVIRDFKQCPDGGFIILSELETSPSEWYITKTDCLGNFDYWDIKCDSKLKEENSIIIYPNPSNDLLNIETDFNIKSIEVFNVLGQNIKYKNYCNCNKQKINIQHLPKGNYFIKIYGEKYNEIDKFIKM